jgi:amino acid permease
MRSALTLPKAFFSILIQCLKGVKKSGLEIMRKTDENYKKKQPKLPKNGSLLNFVTAFSLAFFKIIFFPEMSKGGKIKKNSLPNSSLPRL